jgi:purine-binding chemotaxis protein CheW
LTKSASEPPPSVGMRWRADYIDCLVRRGSDFIIVPNMQAIFTDRNEL